MPLSAFIPAQCRDNPHIPQRPNVSPPMAVKAEKTALFTCEPEVCPIWPYRRPKPRSPQSSLLSLRFDKRFAVASRNHSHPAILYFTSPPIKSSKKTPFLKFQIESPAKRFFQNVEAAVACPERAKRVEYGAAKESCAAWKPAPDCGHRAVVQKWGRPPACHWQPGRLPHRRLPDRLNTYSRFFYFSLMVDMEPPW